MCDSKIFIDLVDYPIDPFANPQQLAPQQLDPQRETTQLWRQFLDVPDAGAHGWFHGVTRRTTGNKVTDLLSYEAHQTMAIKELSRLATGAIDQFGLHRVVIVHRLGEVPVGQASVVIGCSGSHRREVFSAMPWIMDNLKQDVPIWKRETFADGSRQWVHPRTGDT